MSRRIVKKQGKVFLDNDFQKRFIIENNQVDEIIALLEEAGNLPFRIPTGTGKLEDRDVYLKVEDLVVIPPSNESQILMVYNKRTNSSMWFRNYQMISGVKKMYQKEFNAKPDLVNIEIVR